MKNLEKKSFFADAFDFPTIIASVFFLVATISFFYLLAQNTDAVFGFSEILFSVVLSALIVSFLIWLKHFMRSNLYLGLVFGLVALAIFVYSIFIRFQGPKTNMFAIIFTLGSLVYFGYYFFKFWKKA